MIKSQPKKLSMKLLGVVTNIRMRVNKINR